MPGRRGRVRLIGMLALLCGLATVAVATAAAVVSLEASRRYGPAAPQLSASEKLILAARLLSHGNSLVVAPHPGSMEVPFRVDAGEAPATIAGRLEAAGIIGSRTAFLDYLVYTGQDRTVQAGNYKLSGASSGVEISARLQDATPAEVEFVVLPGWRLEEIAAAIPTSGLTFSQRELLEAALTRPSGLDFVPESLRGREGLLAPGSYVFPRSTTAIDFVDALTGRLGDSLSQELRDGFAEQGLTTYQGVILASMVQREAVRADEQPLIASVFLNRLKAGMKLESDPTVQYAIGYDTTAATWWKNPLSAVDLLTPSEFNTYVFPGLPPTPICSPSNPALEAVAHPSATTYYYFRARCDGSGLHTFSETFEAHVAAACTSAP